MYSQEKIDVALKVYHQCGSVTTTIRVLGYLLWSSFFVTLVAKKYHLFVMLLSVSHTECDNY